MKLKTYVDWESFECLIDELIDQISDNDCSIEFITGIPRGGIIPAVVLSHRLKIPYCEFPSPLPPNTLVVDDIADTGETLKTKTYGFQTAVLYYKPHTSCFKPTFWAEEYYEDGWIIFPWERTDSNTIQDYLR